MKWEIEFDILLYIDILLLLYIYLYMVFFDGFLLNMILGLLVVKYWLNGK